MNETPLYSHGKPVGVVRFDAQLNKTVLFKKMNGSEHMLKHPPAIAFGVHILKQAKHLGATDIFIFDAETHIKYATSIADFENKGFKLNRGHGDQIALRLDLWKSSEKKATEQKQGKLL